MDFFYDLSKSLIISSIVFAGLSAQALDTRAYDLVRTENGKKICKVMAESEEVVQCYDLVSEDPTLQAKYGGTIEIIDRLEKATPVMEELNASRRAMTMEDLKTIGGFVANSPEQIQMLRDNFDRVSIRHVGFDLKSAVIEKFGTEGESISVPLVAAIYWKKNAVVQGTIYIEGSIRVDRDFDLSRLTQNLDQTSSAMNEILKKKFKVSSLSDSSTEQKTNSLRFLETTARSIQVKSISGLDADVDAETVRWVEEIFAPFAFMDVVVIPSALNIYQRVTPGLP